MLTIICSWNQAAMVNWQMISPINNQTLVIPGAYQFGAKTFATDGISNRNKFDHSMVLR